MYVCTVRNVRGFFTSNYPIDKRTISTITSVFLSDARTVVFRNFVQNEFGSFYRVSLEGCYVTVFSVWYAQKRSNMTAVVTGMFPERYLNPQEAVRTSYCA
jgi:hypothetical protein